MSNITKIYTLKLTGQKDLVSSMQSVNKSFEDSKKRFLELKAQLGKSGLDNLEIKTIRLEMEQTRLEMLKLKKEQLVLTNEGKAYTNVIKIQREEERQARAEKKLTLSEYQKLSKQHVELRNFAKEVAVVFGEESKEFKQAAQEANLLDIQLKKIDSSLGQYQRKVGNYPKDINITGISKNAFNQLNSAGLGDILGNQINNTKSRVKELDNEFLRLKSRITEARNSGVNDLNSMEKEIIQNRIEADKMNQEISKSTTHLNGLGSVGTGVFGRLNTDIKSLVLGYVGFTAVMSQTQDLFKRSIQIDSMNSALEAVSEKTGDLAVNQQFLEETTERLGLKTIDTTQSFKSFYAASTEAGISGEKTREIYEAAAESSAVLKLSQEQVNGVMLAFGQIASKGKVQAEELRGQIGERIPGAFGIAARAMGVTTQELDKMMSDGKLLSNDFLPKFAAELKKTFGNGGKEIKGLNAELNRLDNIKTKIASNQSFLKLLNLTITIVSFLAETILNVPWKVWIGFVTLLTLAYLDNIKALIANIAQQTIYIARMAAGNVLLAAARIITIAQTVAVFALNVAYRALNATMLLLGTIIPGIRTAWLLLNSTFLATPLGWVMAGLLALGAATVAFGKNVDKSTQSLEKQGKALKQSAEQLRIQNEITKRVNETTTESISKLDTLTKVVKDNKLSLDARKEALRRLIDISPEYLKGLTLENIATEEGIKILDRYKNKILEVARAKAAEQLLSEKLKEKMDIELSLPELETKKQKREETYNKLTFKSIVQDFKQVGKDLGISEGDDIDIYNDKIKKVTELAKEIKILEKDVVEYKTKEIKDSIVNKGGNGETKTGTYKGSKLNGQQKDFLKDVDAIRDTLLANNEKAYTKAEINEKAYLSAILTINNEAWTKKLNYIKGVNAEERKQRAQWQNEQAKLEKDTQEKLFKIDSDALNKRFSLEKKKINNAYKAIIDDPYSTELEKIEAEQEYNYKLLDITLDFNNSMDELEKNYNQNIIESANARATELEEIERKINNTSYKLTEERFQNIKNIVNNAVDSTINEKNITAELEKQKVLLDSNLTTRQKENEINRISFLNEADKTEAELERIRDLINLYNQKLINSTLTVDQQKELNNLLGKESELITRNIENKTKQNKIGFGVGKIDAPSDSNTQNLIKEKILNDLNLDEDAFGSMIGTAISQSWDLASTAMNGYFDAEEARINKSRELAYERIDLEKEQLLAQAQSQAERDSLEKQATEKKKQADNEASARLKKSKKAELQITLATELANIAASAASNPLNGITFGGAGLAMYATMAGLALARYYVNLSNVNKTQFKKGGLFNPKKFAKGGKLTGPSHNQGGIPAINPTTGEQVAELEGEEGIINKRSMKDNSIYSVTGTPSQIASRINAIGGGVDWMGGATMQKFMKGGTYLGSNLQPPVFKSYYDSITQKEKENYNAERLDRIEKNLEKTAQSLNREVNRKTIVSSRELSRVQKENNKQSQIATL